MMILILLFVIGCKPQLTYSQLMEQPALLKKEMEQCEKNPTLADEKTLQCKIVMQAFSRFLSLVKQKEENPEEFGERILQAEMALADTLEEIHHQEQQLKALQTHSSDQLKKIQNKLEEMHAIYDIRESEIKTLLAVILESSPE